MSAAKKKRALKDELADGRSRLCAVLRQPLAPDAGLRFVRSPDGVLTPDLARRLPGRGVWITCSRDIVARAVKTKAFQRGLKQAINIPEELPDLIERLLRKRAMNGLALATKAGEAIAGFAKVNAAIGSGEVIALVHGSDGSSDGRIKLGRKFVAVRTALQPEISRDRREETDGPSKHLAKQWDQPLLSAECQTEDKVARDKVARDRATGDKAARDAAAEALPARPQRLDKVDQFDADADAAQPLAQQPARDPAAVRDVGPDATPDDHVVRDRDAATGGDSAASDNQGNILAQIIDCLTIDEMSLAMGRSNVVHAALLQGGAAKKFISDAKRLQDYRRAADENANDEASNRGKVSDRQATAV